MSLISTGGRTTGLPPFEYWSSWETLDDGEVTIAIERVDEGCVGEFDYVEVSTPLEDMDETEQGFRQTIWDKLQRNLYLNENAWPRMLDQDEGIVEASFLTRGSKDDIWKWNLWSNPKLVYEQVLDNGPNDRTIGGIILLVKVKFLDPNDYSGYGVLAGHPSRWHVG